jgi:hypothetical protein
MSVNGAAVSSRPVYTKPLALPEFWAASGISPGGGLGKWVNFYAELEKKVAKTPKM